VYYESCARIDQFAVALNYFVKYRVGDSKSLMECLGKLTKADLRWSEQLTEAFANFHNNWDYLYEIAKHNEKTGETLEDIFRKEKKGIASKGRNAAKT